MGTQKKHLTEMVLLSSQNICVNRWVKKNICNLTLKKVVYLNLGPSINRLVTDGNTKLCCRGFILVLFQSTTANKIDSEHTRD